MKLNQHATILTALALLGLVACSQAPTQQRQTMTPTHIADEYYAGFRGEVAIADLPLSESIRFRSPIAELEGAVPFRNALAGLFPRVRELEIRQQIAEPGIVITIYDLDLGAAGGPIPMAETIQVSEGEIVDIELIFDPTLLPGPPAES